MIACLWSARASAAPVPSALTVEADSPLADPVVTLCVCPRTSVTVLAVVASRLDGVRRWSLAGDPDNCSPLFVARATLSTLLAMPSPAPATESASFSPPSTSNPETAARFSDTCCPAILSPVLPTVTGE